MFVVCTQMQSVLAVVLKQQSSLAKINLLSHISMLCFLPGFIILISSQIEFCLVEAKEGLRQVKTNLRENILKVTPSATECKSNLIFQPCCLLKELQNH